MYDGPMYIYIYIYICGFNIVDALHVFYFPGPFIISDPSDIYMLSNCRN